MDTIHIETGDYTHGIQKRALGKLNIGVYCQCREFVAFAVSQDNRAKGKVAFACDGPLTFTCPFCRELQVVLVTDFQELTLNEGNKQRPSRPA